MKHKLLFFSIMLLAIAAIGVFVLPQAVYAAQCGDVETAVDFGCQGGDGGIGDAGIYGLLTAFLRFFAIGVGIAVTIGIVWGGLMFITARGNSSQTQKAVNIIVNAVVGLLLFIFMYAIVNFLVPGGLL